MNVILHPNYFARCDRMLCDAEAELNTLFIGYLDMVESFESSNHSIILSEMLNTLRDVFSVASDPSVMFSKRLELLVNLYSLVGEANLLIDNHLGGLDEQQRQCRGS